MSTTFHPPRWPVTIYVAENKKLDFEVTAAQLARYRKDSSYKLFREQVKQAIEEKDTKLLADMDLDTNLKLYETDTRLLDAHCMRAYRRKVLAMKENRRLELEKMEKDRLKKKKIEEDNY